MSTLEQSVQLEDALVETLLSAATAAPSIHNSQPWSFAVRGTSVDLYADPDRQLRSSDSSGRSLLISCGAALLNLRVAATSLGYYPRVRVLPDQGEPTLVARVELGTVHGRPGLLGELAPYITARRTNRMPFSDRLIPSTAIARLSEAVEAEGAILRVYDEPDEVDRIVALMHDADFEETDNPVRVAERALWVDAGRERDGIPAQSLGPVPDRTEVPFRDLAPRTVPPAPDRPLARFERTPTVAVLSTLLDAPSDWVRAGQALERMLLVATSFGLASSFLNQALEHVDLRWLVRSPMTGYGHSQMLMRIGYGPEVPPTPRRPLSEVVRPSRRVPGSS
jgi:nitroreductase